MSAIIATGFDYSAIDGEIADVARATAIRIRDRLQGSVIETGRDLIAIKAKLPHGKFGEWIEAEFQMGDRTARNYMDAAEWLAGKSAKFSVLPPSAVYALASPSAPADAVAEIMAQVERGAVPKVAEIKERIAGASRAAIAAHAMKSAKEETRDREKQKKSRQAHAERERKRREESAAKVKSDEKAAQQIATLLIERLGSAGARELVKKLNAVGVHRVSRLFSTVRDGRFCDLTDDEIRAKCEVLA